MSNIDKVELTKKLYATFRGYTGCFKEFQNSAHKKIYLFEIYDKKYKLDEYTLDCPLDNQTIFKELEKAIHSIKLKEAAQQLNNAIDNLRES